MMTLYNQFQNTPPEAQKPITAGRLKGFTDINPMWRIKRLTEVFGACGIGWWTETVEQWIETGADGVMCAFVKIKLFYKYKGEVSQGVEGMGGSSFVSKEKNGLYTNDECFKMAFTDALGSACKNLGMSSDIYYSKDRSKYTSLENDTPPEVPSDPQPAPPEIKCNKCGRVIKNIKKDGKVILASDVAKQCGGMCIDCYRKASKGEG